MTSIRVLFAGVALAAAACTSSGGGSSTQVGPAGGVAKGPDGSEVEFPRGALSATTTVTISRADVPNLDAQNLSAMSGVYTFSAQGALVSQLITVTLPLDAPGGDEVGTTGLLVLGAPAGSTDWMTVTTAVSAQDDTHVSFTAGSLGSFVVAYSAAALAGDGGLECGPAPH